MAKAMRFVAGAMLSLTLALPAMAEDVTADTVVAVVNGTNITLGNMLVARESLPAQYQALPPETLFKGILDQLIQQTALQQSVGDTLTKRDTLQMENDRRAYLSNVALEPAVTAAVTEEAIKAAYDAKFANATPGTEYHAAHILVDSEEKANELKAQLDGGAVFADLAKANSIDTGSGANGGDLGWFGVGTMVKPFEDAVVAAPVGTVIGPIKTDFGYHLILVSETRAAANPTLDDVRDELTQELQQQAVEAKVKEVTDAAKIEKPGEALDPAVLNDTTLLDK
jgi:peptidyl-prolyl cis-trans isomerase C